MDNYEIKKLFVTHPRMSDDQIAIKFRVASNYVKAVREGFTKKERIEVMEKIKFNNRSRAYAGGSGSAIIRKD